MGVTVKKCHMAKCGKVWKSGNDCWNSACLSCYRKADNELADRTLSGNLFQSCAAVTRNAGPPAVDSLSCGICKQLDTAEGPIRTFTLGSELAGSV